MGPVIAEVVPAAVGLVLVNPMPILAVILLLFSPRAMAAAPAFVAGWVIGLLAVFGVLLFVVALDPVVGTEREPSPLASVVRLLLGAVLLVLAFQRWRGRPQPGEEPKLPAWMTTFEQATPVQALGLGALFSGINPKNLAFTVAAVIVIAQADLTSGAKLVPVAIFVLIGSVGVAAPVIWYAVARDSASATLAGWRVWLMANYAVVMAVVLLVFGVILVTRGLGSLFG
jgi:hypothetical protein